MDKQREEKPAKKFGDRPKKPAGNQSDYQSLLAKGKSKNSETQTQKAFGKSKDISRKG